MRIMLIFYNICNMFYNYAHNSNIQISVLENGEHFLKIVFKLSGNIDKCNFDALRSSISRKLSISYSNSIKRIDLNSL